MTAGAIAGTTSGLHHVSGITGDVQANVDFYVGFLSLKLVKRTAGYADAEQLHLVYGDGLGSPGSLLTFLVWEATSRGRTGIGQVSEVALAVPPPHECGRGEELKVMLPQFALPGEERFPARDLPFIRRFNRPDSPDGTTLVLLHGAGGNEADLMSMARRMGPRATLLGVRSRMTEGGTSRWFRRIDASTFDQADLRGDAEAFATFVEGAVTGYVLDPDSLAFLGYSNGANFLAAVILFHPGVVRRAILLRGIQALENPEAVDLSCTRVLVLDGRDEAAVRTASKLADDLRAGGANVETQVIPAGHDLSGEDVRAAARWLRQHPPGAERGQWSDPSA